MKVKRLLEKMDDNKLQKGVVKQEGISQEVEYLHTSLNTLNNLISQLRTRLTPILDNRQGDGNPDVDKARDERVSPLGEDIAKANDMANKAIDQLEEIFSVIKL
jgi:predicted  nucleic acid-binding Zn-ribbon protein